MWLNEMTGTLRLLSRREAEMSHVDCTGAGCGSGRCVQVGGREEGDAGDAGDVVHQVLG